jgi:hypothetical protein
MYRFTRKALSSLVDAQAQGRQQNRMSLFVQGVCESSHGKEVPRLEEAMQE